jgi:hypothetical protein
MALIIIGLVGLWLDCDATQIVMAQAGFFAAKGIAEALGAAITYWRASRHGGVAPWPY